MLASLQSANLGSYSKLKIKKNKKNIVKSISWVSHSLSEHKSQNDRVWIFHKTFGSFELLQTVVQIVQTMTPAVGRTIAIQQRSQPHVPDRFVHIVRQRPVKILSQHHDVCIYTTHIRSTVERKTLTTDQT